jgi:fructokinase
MDHQASGYPRFVAAGEALTDMVVSRAEANHWRSLCGGATWNVARVVSALGIPSAFAGAISTDVFGDALWADSAQAGLDLRFLQRFDKSPLLAMVYSLDPPRYFFVGDDSADLQFDPSRLPAQWQDHCEWVHFGGISLAREPLAGSLLALAKSLKASGMRISFDPNFRVLMDKKFDGMLEVMVRLADVIKVSDEDLLGLFRTQDAKAAFHTLRSWNPDATVLFTRGADGASLYHGDQTWHAKPPPVDVVDTVGAGDASMGGLLLSLMRDPDANPAAHLRHAIAAGAGACIAAGANPPSLALVESLLAQVVVTA